MWSWLMHPMARGLDPDDPAAVLVHRDIVARKPFLRDIYRDWYAAIVAALPQNTGPVLEIGSGAGFLDEVVPNLITSDVVATPRTMVVLDAQALPFRPSALRGIVMTNVLHHVPDASRFFKDAARVVRPGGALVMLEPWLTPWSRFIYTRVHHEPCDPGGGWTFRSSGRLSGANSALPWILFARDRARFEQQFPEWRIDRVEPGMPFRYLLSGGVSMRSLAPSMSTPLVRAIERALTPWADRLAMFALIKLVRLAA